MSKDPSEKKLPSGKTELAELVRRVSEAEAALQAHVGTSGQIDSIMGASGHPFLLQGAQSKLIASEAKLRHLTEELEVERSRLVEAQAVAKVGSWETDLVTLAVRWSAETHRIFETDSTVFTPTHPRFLAIVHPEDRAAVDQAFRDSIGQTEPQRIEHRVLLSDGRIKFIEERWQVFTGPDRQSIRATGTCQDITERILIAQRIAAEQQLNQSLIENSPLAIIVYKATGEAVMANASSARMLGAPDVAAVKAQNFRHIKVWQETGLLTAADTALAQGKTSELEIHSINSFGKEIWINCRLIPLTYQSEKHLFCFFDDIRERMRAELTLRESEARFRQTSAQLAKVLDSSLDVICTFDAAGRFIQVSAACERVWGYTPEELLGTSFIELVHPEDREKTRKVDAGILAGNAVTHFENRYLRKDGSVVHMRWSAWWSDADQSNFCVGHDNTEKRRADEALHDRNEKFNQLADHVTDVFWVRSPDMKELHYISPAYEKVWGRPIAVLQETPEHWLEFVFPEDRPWVEQKYTELTRDLPSLDLEYRVVMPEGEIRWVRARGFQVRDATGQLVRLTGIASDITARKTAELELLNSNRALEMLSRCNMALIRAEAEKDLLHDICRIAVEIGGFRMAAVGYAMDDETKSIEIQATAGVVEDYFSQIKGLSWADDHPAGQGPAGRVIRTGTTVVIPDLKQETAFSSWLPFALDRGYAGLICLPLNDKVRTYGMLALYPPVVRLVATDELSLLQDLANDMAFGIRTLRLRAEQRRIQQEVAQQAALLDQAQDAIFVQDLQHRITYWNKGAERLYGYAAERALGQSLDQLLRVDGLRLAEAQRQVREKGEWSGEVQKFSAQNKILTVNGRWTLLRDENGQPKSILTLDTDITEKKLLESQFLRAQRMESIGTLAGGIAHDLNNLLAPICMGVTLLKRFDPNPKSLGIIEAIERSANRGTDLVKQVLSFARGVDGARTPVHLKHIINEIKSITESTFAKNITVKTSVAADLKLVLGDSTQLNQVVLNLCVNARDAMPHGGQLELAATNVEIDRQYAAMNQGAKAGRYVMLKVTDTGTGMPKEIIDRIFDPFFTTKELGHGTGLGLSTVLGIVRSHGGFTDVASEPGNGSVFKIYLPEQPDGPQVEATAEGAPVMPRGNGELIMLVDDEVSVLEVMQLTLVTFGYRVITAEDGAQAIATYATQPDEIAVVLTDMMMPVMDGSALIVALQRINPEVRVIAATGLSGNSKVTHASVSGVKHFLTKPFSAEKLLRTVGQALHDKGSCPPM